MSALTQISVNTPKIMNAFLNIMVIVYFPINYIFSVQFRINLLHDLTLRFQNSLIAEEHRDSVVEHIVLVHTSVVDYSKQFLQRLRRSNFVTPKNYLDFINTYLKLLQDKDKFILSQVSLKTLQLILRLFVSFC